MNIRDRLALSARSGMISLIREGIFLRCYQESLFSLFSISQEVKVLGRQFKNLEGQWVFYGGFPASQIMHRLPNATETEWGFEAECDDVLPDKYQEWIAGMMAGFESDKVTPKAPETVNGNKKRVLTQSRRVNLTNEDCYFLSLWRPGLFSPEVNAGFIESLRRSLGFDENAPSDVS
ncbi:hypothetical protein [Citrobacter portucalensis]|uniref:hypothetical protein n=1 Tax=Citrobacter portucalensis TaxID=1639133 RepID=UPI001F3D7ACA|nr:hypothetical protein [Citrobacter portucalensis]